MMQVTQSFLNNGFDFIENEKYLHGLDEHTVSHDLNEIKNMYKTRLKADGPRNRAYLKLEWEKKSGKLSVAKNQSYFQSPETNVDDGGKIRRFATMDPEILKIRLIQQVIEKNIEFIKKYASLNSMEQLTLGLHFIQYYVGKNGASYSSPVGLHLDDEPLVFVHLVDLSENAIGGDNLIANFEDKTIQHVIRLEKPLESLVLNRGCYHAVTPLGSRKGTAYRDIILFTIEPDNTQKTES